MSLEVEVNSPLSALCLRRQKNWTNFKSINFYLFLLINRYNSSKDCFYKVFANSATRWVFYVAKYFKILQNQYNFYDFFRIMENWTFDIILLSMKWFCLIPKRAYSGYYDYYDCCAFGFIVKEFSRKPFVCSLIDNFKF